jgi:hypothetical protein
MHLTLFAYKNDMYEDELICMNVTALFIDRCVDFLGKKELISVFLKA